MRTLHAPRVAEIRGPCAFTLIEMILVIAVMLLAMTALVPLLSNRADERELKAAADTLEKFARTARAKAAYRGAQASIIFSESGFSLYVSERDEAGMEATFEREDDGMLWEVEGGASSAKNKKQADDARSKPKESHELGKGVVVKLRPWLSTRWSQPADYLWEFQKSGLCEPLAVRFELGESWIELAFNPLTAQVQEESYAFQ